MESRLNNQSVDNLLHLLLNEALVSINAKSGSLMILDELGKTLKIKSRLGPPNPERISEPIFRFEDKLGIAVKVIREKKAYISNNLAKDKYFNNYREKTKLKSILCVPIIYSKKVLGVINIDDENENCFKAPDIDKVSNIILKYEKFLTNRVPPLQSLAETSKLLTLHHSHENIEIVLKKIAKNALTALGADIVILYQYDNKRSKFLGNKSGPVYAGDIKYPKFMTDPVHPQDVPYQILKNQHPLYIEENIQSQQFLTQPISRGPGKNRDRFTIREKVASLAALKLTVSSTENGEDENVGVMFVNYRDKYKFDDEEKHAIETFASVAAITIYNTRKEYANFKEKMGIYSRINKGIKYDYKINEKSVEDYLGHFTGNSFILAIDIRKSTVLMLNATDRLSYVQFVIEIEKGFNQIIKDNYGIVDKFTGDGILAYFIPDFTGDNAGVYCINAALKCNELFIKVFEKHKNDFQLVTAETGLGIGIDFGKINCELKEQQLIVVGAPVVLASRLSTVPAGTIALNQQAYKEIIDHTRIFRFEEMLVSLKHEGACYAYKVADYPYIEIQKPKWVQENENKTFSL